MENYLKKVMGLIWSPFFVLPFIYILMKNYFAFVENEDFTMDSPVIVIKSNFVKFILICVDCLIIYTFYTFLKDKFRKKLSKKTDIYIKDESVNK